MKVGEHSGAEAPLGSGRINLNLLTPATVVDVQFCSSAAAQPGFPSVDILADNSSTDIFIRDTALNVGIAKTLPKSTASVNLISNDGGKVYVGDGVTMVKFAQAGAAASEIMSAATIPKVEAFGTGTLVTEGDYTITTLDIDGPTVYSNHIKTAGSAITTANLDGGQLIGTQSGRARTWDAVNYRGGVTLSYDDEVVTITSLNKKGGALV